MEFEEYEEDFDMSTEEIDEIKEIANQIRRDNVNHNMTVYVNSHLQIIVEVEIENCETTYNIMNIMDELKFIHSRYMFDFESTFEIWMDKGKPHIYCTYERIKTD
jgi:hypothetical protein